MAKQKEDRKIPDLVIGKALDNPPFDLSDRMETDDYTCFGVTKKNSRALSLKIIFSDGKIALIQYSRMLTPIIYNGQKFIKIDIPDYTINIQGSNLVPLVDLIAEHRLAWIRSNSIDSPSDAIMMRQGEPDILSIQFHRIQQDDDK